MNRILTVVLAVCALSFSDCTNNSEEGKSGSAPKDTIINPNGSSELSLLMRQMQDSVAELKKLIEEGKQLGDFRLQFRELLTATPTDSSMKIGQYNDFAGNFFSSLGMVYQSEEGSVVEKYNEMVNACVDCHSEYCPGSIKKIRKLLIVAPNP